MGSNQNSTTMQSRNWLFTINNPDFMEPSVWDGVKYICYQEEKGENGTRHYQGYVMFESNRRLCAVKQLCPRAHWEIRRGTHEQAVLYCTKLETRTSGPWISGTPPKPGKRSDMDAVHEMLLAGESEKDISNEHFGAWTRCYKAIRAYKILQTVPCKREIFTQVYWGPPGTGKTHRCFAEADENDLFVLSPPNAYSGAIWWDGYQGQSCVIIDEFYGWIGRDFMLRLCDKYALTVQTKGGTVPFLATKIWITSNTEPSEWWPNKGLGAMTRRLEEPMGNVQELTEVYADKCDLLEFDPVYEHEDEDVVYLGQNLMETINPPNAPAARRRSKRIFNADIVNNTILPTMDCPQYGEGTRGGDLRVLRNRVIPLNPIEEKEEDNDFGYCTDSTEILELPESMPPLDLDIDMDD